MIALVVIITSVVIGSILPPRVVAELELNSVKPPPDTKTKRENKYPVMKNITEKPKSHYST